MKKNQTYTKKQIVEAIKHWQNVLKRMDESKSPLLDALIDKFGKQIVESKKRNVVLTSKLCYDILDVLNPIFFDGILQHIPIKCMHYSDIISYSKALDAKYDIFDYEYPKNGFLGLFTSYIDSKDPSIKTIDFNVDLISKDPIIYINYDMVMNTSFIFAVATLCHELIHYYDSLIGEYVELKRIEYMEKTKKDDHTTNTFINKLNEANENGLNVIINGENKLIEVLDLDAIKKMQQMILENNNGKLPFISPKDSTENIHIYSNGRFRTFS